MELVCAEDQLQSHDQLTWFAVAKPKEIIALSSFDINKIASGPKSLPHQTCHQWQILQTYGLHFFLRLFSGVRSLTGTVFTWCFPSLVFLGQGRRQRYKALRLKWMPNYVISLCRSSNAVMLQRHSVLLRLSAAVEFWTNFTIVETRSGCLASIHGLPCCFWLNDLRTLAASLLELQTFSILFLRFCLLCFWRSNSLINLLIKRKFGYKEKPFKEKNFRSFTILFLPNFRKLYFKESPNY